MMFTRAIRWPGAAAVGKPAVTFVHGDGEVFEWDLAVTLEPDNQVVWAYHFYGIPESRERGGGITWANGRLCTQMKPASVAFYRLIKHLDISFGQIEAELREMTGYRDPMD